MAELPFSIELIRYLADTRTTFLTAFFQLFTFLGEVEGYVFLISLIYVTYDKRLAFRLSVLTLVTMSLNHLLKSVIMNPRPFVTEGSYADRWAVSAAKAEDLATEYSTPSGHAMAGSAFYTYLYASLRNGYVRATCVLLILLTGLSRPYLGVHYLEDVLIGWALGIAIALLATRYAEAIQSLSRSLSHPQQIGIVVAASLGLWLATRVLSGWQAEGQPLAFVGYTGFLTGIVIAYPLEARRLGFDPRSSTVTRKLLRFGLTVLMIMATLLLLDEAFGVMADDATPLGYLLRYIRYATAGIVGMFLGPLLLVKVGLAQRISADSEPGHPPTRR